jgi:hypothetical protein
MIHFDSANEYSDDMTNQADDMLISVRCNTKQESGPGCSNYTAKDVREPVNALLETNDTNAFFYNNLHKTSRTFDSVADLQQGLLTEFGYRQNNDPFVDGVGPGELLYDQVDVPTDWSGVNIALRELSDQ